MTSSNWWANKLGTSATPQAQSYPAPVPPQVLQQAAYSRPPQTTQAQPCPNCRSGNYGKLTPETRARCYDCGYPLIQQGSGLSLPQTGAGPAKPARQSVGDGWNPGTIIGRL